jgi:hypothetical protein
MVSLQAQDLAGVEIHGFVTQGFLFSSHNNYLTMHSDSGSFQWTDGAVSVTDSLTDSLRVGIQLHMYQLGQLGGPHLQVDWAVGKLLDVSPVCRKAFIQSTTKVIFCRTWG